MARTVTTRPVSGYAVTTAKQISLSPDGRFLLGMCHFSASLTDSYHGIWNGSAYVPVSPDDKELNERCAAWGENSDYYVIAKATASAAIAIQLRTVDPVTGSATVVAVVTGLSSETLVGVTRIVGDWFIAWTSQRIYVLHADTSAGTLTLTQTVATSATHGTMREVLGTHLDGIFVVSHGGTAAQVTVSTATLNVATGQVTFHVTQPGAYYAVASDLFAFEFKAGTRFLLVGAVTTASSRLMTVDASGPIPLLIVHPAGTTDTTLFPNNQVFNELSSTNGQAGGWVFNDTVMLLIRASVGSGVRVGRERYFDEYPTALDIAPINLLATGVEWNAVGLNMKKGRSADKNLFAVAHGSSTTAITVLEMVDDSPQPADFIAQARKHTAQLDIELIEPETVDFFAQARKHTAALEIGDVEVQPVYLIAQARKHDASIEVDVEFSALFSAQAKKHSAALIVNSGAFVEFVAQAKKHVAHLDTPVRRRRIMVSVNRK